MSLHRYRFSDPFTGAIRRGTGLLLCLLLTAGLCGCSSNPDSVEESGAEHSTSSRRSESNPSESATAIDEDGGQPAQPTGLFAEGIEPSPEILETPLYGCAMQVGNTVIHAPAKYSDFTDAGAAITDKDVAQNSYLEPGASELVHMKVNTTQFTLKVVNNTAKSQPLVDGDVEYIFDTRGPDIIYPGGIRVGSSLGELGEAWGDPTYEENVSMSSAIQYNYLEYPTDNKLIYGIGSPNSAGSVSGTGYRYALTVDRGSSSITGIVCRWISKSADAAPATITRELSDGRLCTFQIPYYFFQNQLTNNGKYMTVYLIESIPYTLIIDSHMYSMNSQEEELSEILARSFSNYETEVLHQTESDLVVAAYLYYQDSVECEIIVVKGAEARRTSTSKLFPSQEGVGISATSVKAFKSIMASFARSITWS